MDPQRAGPFMQLYGRTWISSTVHLWAMCNWLLQIANDELQPFLDRSVVGYDELGKSSALSILGYRQIDRQHPVGKLSAIPSSIALRMRASWPLIWLTRSWFRCKLERTTQKNRHTSSSSPVVSCLLLKSRQERFDASHGFAKPLSPASPASES